MFSIDRYLNRIIIVLMIFVASCNIFAQREWDHPFPRTGVFQWSGAPADWYARFDMVMARIDGKEFILSVKEKNPETMWLVARDFNRADERWSAFENGWFLITSAGTRVPLYSQDTYYANFTDVCPDVNGKNFQEEYIAHLTDLVLSSGADGIATDGLRSRIHFATFPLTDIDSDRNGVNDIDEHSYDWFLSHLEDGVNDFLGGLRASLGEDKIIIINGWPNQERGPDLINGYIEEHKIAHSNGSFSWEKAAYFAASEKTYQPHILLCNVDPIGYGIDSQLRTEFGVANNRDLFPYMRFLLGRSTILGLYFEYEDGDGPYPESIREHFWHKYYDEYDLNIGYPTSSIQKVKGSNDGAQARFFDNGAVVVNLAGSPITVTNSDLAGLTGYDGPYYRFRGGQAPDFNDGTEFTQVELYGDFANNKSNLVLGDAIFLVKEPQTVVSDIIIDNCSSGTSPGSAVPVFTSGWEFPNCSSGSRYFTLYCLPYFGSYGYAMTSPGTGTEKATYRPMIGVAGNYEIFEWHGYIGSSESAFVEATNAPFKIGHHDGTTTVSVDLSKNYGQWNSLGTYQLTTGNNNYVQISNNANGPVTADAIKFVFTGVSGLTDTTPPSAPGSIQVNQNN